MLTGLMSCVRCPLPPTTRLIDRGVEYISPTSYEDVVELLVPELQRRGIYWDDYAFPGGTLRENMFAKEGASIDPAHPAYDFKWDIRPTNGPSAWESRVNGLKEAHRSNGASSDVDVGIKKLEIESS